MDAMDHSIHPGPDQLERSYQNLLDEQRRNPGDLVDPPSGPLLNPPGESFGEPSWQLEVGETDQVEPQVRESRASGLARAAPTAPPPLLRIVEALLFVGGPPLTPARASEVIRSLSDDHFLEAIAELNQGYREQGRPYVIQSQDAGYVLALGHGYRFVVEKFQAGSRQARLSAAAVDVLAIVAYRQPVSRREVEGLRGHESGLILRQLVRRGLVAAVNRAESGGREVHYGTTQRFLSLFGLDNLDDLPQTEDLQKL